MADRAGGPERRVSRPTAPAKPAPLTTAKAYRLLRSVLMTAVNEDRIIPRNPCQVRGADKEHPTERPVLSTTEVVALADTVPARYRAMIVRRPFVEVRGEGLIAGPPKSQAGGRTVSFPPPVVEAMRTHVAADVDDDPTALVFTGPKGGSIWHGNFRKLMAWRRGGR